MDIIVFFIIIIGYIIIFSRNRLFNYITNLDKQGKLTESNSTYNNYFSESKHKNDRILINNVAFIRKGIISNIYDGDLKIMEFKKLKDGDNILIFNNNDCNFETYLAQNLYELDKNVKIIIAKTNIIETEKCKNLIDKSGFKNIEVKYLNDLDNLNDALGIIKFKRIILRENIGRIDERGKILNNFKNLLEDIESFIYLKTLVFTETNNDTFILKKQFDIIDFWNYNFSTTKDIVNDFLSNGYEVKYKDINVLLLCIFYNPRDIINILKLYFVDLNLNITDIINWLGIYTLNLLHIKAYKSS